MSLIIKDLSFSYDRKIILKSLNEKFLPGEISIIAGPNGSGKTTFLKAIMNLVKVKKNKIFLKGRDIHSYSTSERARHMGYVAQNMSRDFDFTVYEIVEMGRYPYKKDWNTLDDIKYINRAMELTDIEELSDRSVNTLSGGELQRVLLARALAGNPDHLILDEPSSNLDIKHNIEIMRLISKLTKELNITTIMVLHDLNSILHYGDKVVLLKDGEILHRGSPQSILVPEIIKSVYGIKSTIITDNNNLKHIITT